MNRKDAPPYDSTVNRRSKNVIKMPKPLVTLLRSHKGLSIFANCFWLRSDSCASGEVQTAFNRPGFRTDLPDFLPDNLPEHFCGVNT